MMVCVPASRTGDWKSNSSLDFKKSRLLAQLSLPCSTTEVFRESRISSSRFIWPALEASMSRSREYESSLSSV